jgi:AraC-like DNA-binding protein
MEFIELSLGKNHRRPPVHESVAFHRHWMNNIEELLWETWIVAQKKMDISPVGELIPVRMKNQPLSPWLRLAHYSKYKPEGVTHTANVRVIHDFEFVIQVEGSAWIWSEPLGGSFDVQAGDVVLIPPYYPHGWASEAGTHIAVHFDLQAQPQMAAMKNMETSSKVMKRKPLDAVQIPRTRLIFGREQDVAQDSEVIIPLITTVRAPKVWKERFEPLIELYSRRAHRTLSAQILAQETLVWALQTLVREQPSAQPASRESDSRVLELLRELDRNPHERPSIDELAERTGMGLTAFRSAFHRITGRSPRDYIEQQRVERTARVLVETDRRIVDLARAEGYDDPYHFSRIFKRVMGSSPRNYRRQARRLGT